MPSCSEFAAYLGHVRDVRLAIERRCDPSAEREVSAIFLNRLEDRLVRPPRVVLLGEANSGKSSLANALLGQDLLVTDIVSSTRLPILVRYADRAGLRHVCPDGTRRPLTPEMAATAGLSAGCMLELGLPIDMLRRLEIIDTPPASTGGEHDAAIKLACRHADAAVWCTLATQAWKASEVRCWQRISPRLRTSSLLAVTHGDCLDGQDLARVRARLAAEAVPAFHDIALLALRGPEGSRACRPGADGREQATDTVSSALEPILQSVERQRMQGAQRAVHRFLGRMGPEGEEHETARAPMPLPAMTVQGPTASMAV